MPASQEWPTTQVSLLAKIRDPQDDEAWQRFVVTYAPVVYNYCRRRGLQHADAQNVEQEVLSRVSLAIRGFEYDENVGYFRSWLGLITHQQMLKYRQRELRAQILLAEAAARDSSDEFTGELEGAWTEAFNAHIYGVALENIRKDFAPELWQAFELVWSQQRRPADVARELEIPSQRVYQLKFQIVQRLREEIQRLCDDIAGFHRA